MCVPEELLFHLCFTMYLPLLRLLHGWGRQQQQGNDALSCLLTDIVKSLNPLFEYAADRVVVATRREVVRELGEGRCMRKERLHKGSETVHAGHTHPRTDVSAFVACVVRQAVQKGIRHLADNLGGQIYPDVNACRSSQRVRSTDSELSIPRHS